MTTFEAEASSGGQLLVRLRDLQQRHSLIGVVRGLGMMLGLETVRDRSTREPAAARWRRSFTARSSSG